MKKNIFKKTIVASYITSILVGLILPVSFSLAQVVSPCVPPAVQVTLPNGNTYCKDLTYHFLAPLPCEKGTQGCDVSGQLTTFDPTNNNGENSKIGEYLNIMIRIFIGICAVLAVIMIVVGGLEYMTSELLSSKENGRHRITGAIFGLILALGAWTILNQINPDILNTDLKSLENVVVTVELEEDAIQETATNKPCIETDMETIPLFGYSVTVNKSVKTALQNIETAWKNKGGNSFYKINSISGYVCKKVTNKPGYWSAHAFGLAVDINPGTNPYGKTLVTDMLTPNNFSQVFTSAGWRWGGNWVNIKDAMHFSSNGQ